MASRDAGFCGDLVVIDAPNSTRRAIDTSRAARQRKQKWRHLKDMNRACLLYILVSQVSPQTLNHATQA